VSHPVREDKTRKQNNTLYLSLFQHFHCIYVICSLQSHLHHLPTQQQKVDFQLITHLLTHSFSQTVSQTDRLRQTDWMLAAHTHNECPLILWLTFPKLPFPTTFNSSKSSTVYFLSNANLRTDFFFTCLASATSLDFAAFGALLAVLGFPALFLWLFTPLLPFCCFLSFPFLLPIVASFHEQYKDFSRPRKRNCMLSHRIDYHQRDVIFCYYQQTAIPLTLLLEHRCGASATASICLLSVLGGWREIKR